MPFPSAPFAGRPRVRLLLAGAALVLAASGGYAFIHVGSYLAADDPLVHADAILVLAGSDIERPLEAVDLYTTGYAARIVLTRETLEPAMELVRKRGIEPPFEVEWQRSVLVRQAQETLDILAGSQSTDVEDDAEAVLAAGDVLDAELLAERMVEVDTRTAAERAAADRTWTFGHVVVDEAQELSAMAWRTVLRWP